MLDDRGILYALDYVVNSGGVIQVADELHGFSFERARSKAEQIFETTRRIFALAADEGVPPRRRSRPAGGAPDGRGLAAADHSPPRLTFPVEKDRQGGTEHGRTL